MKPDKNEMTEKKEILLEENAQLKSIQNTFNAFYPFLRIEFYNGKKKSSSLRDKNFFSEYAVKDVTSLNAPQSIDVSETRTIEQVEKDFKIQAGLFIEVFRKSGNIWNEISLTDSWTLESQNAAGEFICHEIEMGEADNLQAYKKLVH